MSSEGVRLLEMSNLPGLDYSSAGSEISDEEDEYGSKLGKPAPPGLGM